ncbi:MAG: precorrin-2 dehydrogenase/sirohydrochlorin ferrochelatase family protein [Cellulosilyticaceae bacterium]
MYAAMLNIENKIVTIIGGGKIAYHKAHAFIEACANVQIISKQIDERFFVLKNIEIIRQNVDENSFEKYVKNSFVIVAATNDKTINKAIGKYCKEHNKLCNVVDNAELSSFIVPATLKRGDLHISVSTNGKSPALTKKIRDDLANQYSYEYSEYIECLGRIRKWILANIDDAETKKVQLHKLLEFTMEELCDYEKSHCIS